SSFCFLKMHLLTIHELIGWRKIVKITALILTVTMVFSAIIPSVAQAATEHRGEDIGPDSRTLNAYRELQGRRVRLMAPSISPEWMIGRLAGSVHDTLEILSERGTERIPRASVKDLEVSMGRHRNTIKGMAFGALAGLGAAFLLYPYGVFDDERRGEVGEKDRADRFFYAILVVPLATVCGTLVGARTVSEKWVEVSPSRINLSITPTRDKGLRAAVSFNF
ncbi:MAG: hypothetical protein OXU79_21275, partial [Gemmatimonadota bacterium]|nr:hypothetical protein [Gemmatimonadota bacterium]